MQTICHGNVIVNEVDRNSFFDCDIFAPWELDDQITKSSIVLEDREPSEMFIRAPVDDYDIEVPESCVTSNTRTQRRSGGKPLYHFHCVFGDGTTDQEAIDSFEDVATQVKQ